MSLYVPRVGTFDPSLPEWLVLGPDGRLYNITAVANRLSLVEPWVPPDNRLRLRRLRRCPRHCHTRRSGWIRCLRRSF